MKLRDIPVGKIFSFNNRLFIKNNNLGEVFCFVNCARLTDGEAVHISPNTKVGIGK